jgi:O-antigen/teichoic acid export membrane protein
VSEPHAKTASLREQSAWLLLAKIVAFGFSFFLPILIVRALSQESVGHYREAFQVITNAVVLLPLGFSMSAYYFLARETEKRPASILNILLFNFVIGGLACVTLTIWPDLIGDIFQSVELTRLAPKIGVVIWIWVFSTFLETVAVANQEARLATAFIISASLTKTLLLGGAVLLFGTVESFLYAAMLQGVLQTGLLITYLWSRFPRFWRHFDLSFFREQMIYAVPFGVTGILWMAQNDLHIYFVGYKFSSSELAIYAYGCFQVPLIAILSDSITSVLIPRMNALQLVGNRHEMIRLMARATHKLAFFYFPIYAFLLITAHTFITTLFTEAYEASVPVFVINLTLLPVSILVTDPIVRSFKELGKALLVTRVLVLTSMIAIFYFALDRFSLTGMITVAVCAIISEKAIAVGIVIRKLDLGLHHVRLLTGVAKTGAASVAAGLVTFLAYTNFHVYIRRVGEQIIQDTFGTHEATALHFGGGVLILSICAAVFTPIYLAVANGLGLIEDEEKQAVRAFLRQLFPDRSATKIVETHS